ncbi:siderophore-interacting protein [Aeromicrobium fastidiosum]|uniref:Siderophore-interacting protein n=2 Tax=Aeromicrobium fastidiosum TaxID=52699 RepID=A0A641ATN8_9ACTN|nr:siderophore-interacting protein [Aeromicrobium fastidiosum]
MITADVVRTSRLSPSLVGVTISGPQLARYRYVGDDQMFRFFFRRPGQQELRMPSWSHDGWLAQWLLMAPSTRPHVRLYTARAFRPETLELDIEFVAHGDTSPGSGWALSAKPGETVGIFDEGTTYAPPPGSGRQLLVGDESALPAILAILEQAPRDLEAQVFLEVPHAGDVRDVRVPAGVTMHWLPREDEHAVPGRLALQTLSETVRPRDRPAYAFIAGESGLATGARRFLVNEVGMPKTDITFQGYWKHGKASPG